VSDPSAENDFFFGGGGAVSFAPCGIFGVFLQPLPACLPATACLPACAGTRFPLPACHPLPLPASLCCIAFDSVFEDTKPLERRLSLPPVHP